MEVLFLGRPHILSNQGSTMSLNSLFTTMNKSLPPEINYRLIPSV